ncbi:MAG: sugar phosphate isomerase/epimerase [Acidobacteriaceae bacterium]|nr:sugar phosphate isomerase/epimerase [Acidobacteriaceae bacterium]
MSAPRRLAICNELFQQCGFEDACREIRAIGYEGLEIAPFTLASDPASLSADERRRIRQTMRKHDLEFVGFHWLLAAPEGLHATTRDESIRKRTWDYVHALIDLCGDLAEDGAAKAVMVFGSPKQRSTVDETAPREAADILTHGLAHAAPRAESRSVTILLEALSPGQTDVVNCMSDAVAIVKQIRSTAIQTMFDTHNAKDEKEAHTDLLRKYAPYIRHVHLNELDGREPGAGDYDFDAVLATLEELNYSGWVSVEALNFSGDAREVALRAIHRLSAAPKAASGAL